MTPLRPAVLFFRDRKCLERQWFFLQTPLSVSHALWRQLVWWLFIRTAPIIVDYTKHGNICSVASSTRSPLPREVGVDSAWMQ